MLLIIKGKDWMAGSVTNAWTNQRACRCTEGGISGRLVKAAGKETFYPGAFRHFFHLGQLNGGATSSSFFFFFYCEGWGQKCDSGNTIRHRELE